MRLIAHFIQYPIMKFNNVIEISLSHETIQIKNSKNGLCICIFISRVWNGTRFIVSDGAFEKMSVLHPCVKKNEYRMFEHLTSALQHIISNISEDDLLNVYAALLSLKAYSSILKKFQKIWQNNIIRCQYKILKYKKCQNLISQYECKHELNLFYENKMKICSDIIKTSKQMTQ